MNKTIEKTVNGVLVKAKIQYDEGATSGVLTWISPPGADADGPVTVVLNSMQVIRSANADNGCTYDLTPNEPWIDIDSAEDVTVVATCSV